MLRGVARAIETPFNVSLAIELGGSINCVSPCSATGTTGIIVLKPQLPTFPSTPFTAGPGAIKVSQTIGGSACGQPKAPRGSGALRLRALQRIARIEPK